MASRKWHPGLLFVPDNNVLGVSSAMHGDRCIVIMISIVNVYIHAATLNIKAAF